MPSFVGVSQDGLGTKLFEENEKAEGEGFKIKSNLLISEVQIRHRFPRNIGKCKRAESFVVACGGVGFGRRETGFQGVRAVGRGALGYVDDVNAGSAANADGGPNGFVVGVRSNQQSPRHAYALHIER